MERTDNEQKSQGKKRTPFVNIASKVAVWIDNKANLEEINFCYDYCVVNTNTSFIIIRVDPDKTCAIVSEHIFCQNLASAMLKLVLASGNDDYRMTANQLVDLLKYWTLHTRKVIEMPQAFRFFEDKELCFYRAPAPLPAVGNLLECPILMGLNARMSHFKYFAMFLYKSLQVDAYRKQALVIYGDSDSGKTSIVEAVGEWLGFKKTEDGGIMATCSTDDFQSQFIMSRLVKKKFVYVDEPNPNFIKSTAFKSLTGQDLISVNPKNKAVYNALAEFVFIFTSNEEPPVSSDDAIKTRIIPIHISNLDKDDILPNFKELIKPEIPHLLAYGRDCLKECGISPKQELPVNWTDHQDLVDTGDVGAEIIFERVFVKDAYGYLHKNDFVKYIQRDGNASLRDSQLNAALIIKKYKLKVEYNRESVAENGSIVSKRVVCVHGIRPSTITLSRMTTTQTRYS